MYLLEETRLLAGWRRRNDVLERQVTRESAAESVSIGVKCREGNEIRLHKGLLPDARRAKSGPKLAPYRRGGKG